MELRVKISTECYEKVKQLSTEYGFTVQEYIRFLLGDLHIPPMQALVKAVKSRYNVDDTFMFKNVIQGVTMDKNTKAALGRTFNNYIEENDCGIIEYKKTNRGVIYKRIS